ncbi:zinc finger protein [Sodiomyces alkalinus F11]|uniref:Zinc finger protein n=1 Tax=Sodiomyces alkalinus (strain CBS 110278 / VKM F-3762 / F11) TaxID=1314773 RepID=A0A3N2PVM8_SODAK|nr:zinc finger protein [Sodiomyces alkalinus F11]ROT38563.1 zinc finger protein [Sodiomyces alkalinus F11]
MSKRKAEADIGGIGAEIEGPVSKRLLVEAPEPMDAQSHDHDEYDDSTSSSGDTATKADTVYTATTTVSNRSRKFPSDLKIIKCTYPDCEKTFNRPARLAAHLRSHTDDRPFTCTYDGCDKSYREEKHLRQHIKGSHTQERAYTCTTGGCNKSFLTATRLRRHQEVHTGQERYRCREYPPCDQSFRKHSTLQRHIRAEHQGGPAFLCSETGCGAGFDSQGALRNHKKREHSEPSFWCDECAQEVGEDGKPRRVGFVSLLHLQTHIRKEHLNCIFCDQRCKGQGELEKHVELHHSDIPLNARKTIQCTWDGCGKKFTKKNNLNAHVRSVHQGVRFICGRVDHSGTADLSTWWSNEQGCGASFVTKGNLEIHIRHVHLGVQRPGPVLTASTECGSTQRKCKKPTENIIDAITGVNRNVACTVPGCSERFIRHYDLEQHLANHPDVSTPSLERRGDSESNDAARIESVACGAAGGDAAIDGAHRAMPELPFLGMTQTIAYRNEPSAPMGSMFPPFPDDEQFWFGAGDDFDFDVPGGGDASWQRDEAEMRALIDGELDKLIDPALGGA